MVNVDSSSPQQVATHEEMRRAGATVGVAGDVDQAVELLGEWGILPGGRP
jgi:hypothetical protein